MPGDFERLAQLAPGDAQGFVRLRRDLIAGLIEGRALNANHLTALQCEIDCRRAAALAPRQALEAIMQLLEERVGELKQLSEQLIQAAGAPPAQQ